MISFDRSSESPRSPGPARNVLGGVLETCSTDPLTGFLRDGCCQSVAGDGGSHTVCAVMTREFLDFTVAAGNDLVTPRPEWGFAGLVPGDRWCLCALRWLEAAREGSAPPVVLAATHADALRVIPLEILERHAAD